MQMVHCVWEIHIFLHSNILRIFEYFLPSFLLTFTSSVLFRLFANERISSTRVDFIIFLNFPVAQMFGLPGLISPWIDFPGMSKLKSSGIVTPLFQAFLGSWAEVRLSLLPRMSCSFSILAFLAMYCLSRCLWTPLVLIICFGSAVLPQLVTGLNVQSLTSLSFWDSFYLSIFIFFSISHI